MKILVAAGAFKDVYDPVEACRTIGSSLDAGKHTLLFAPVCDGGEYTLDVLRQYVHLREERVENVLNACGEPVTTRYAADGDTAYIVSSEVLRLLPEQDAQKNPLLLTDYGVGQLLTDAIQKGYRRLNLCIGGTSTACCGMGMLQALGGALYGENGALLGTPVRGGELTKITRIDASRAKLPASVALRVIGDGDAKSFELPPITRLKIGRAFSEQADQIVQTAMDGVQNVIRLTGVRPDAPFTGAAGGLAFGIAAAGGAEYEMGCPYFMRLFGVERQMEAADLVITGEGRFDNTACGKTPVSVAALAKAHGKPLLFVCGGLARGAVRDVGDGIVRDDPALTALGIDCLVTCQPDYDQMLLPADYADCVQLYRRMTPRLLREKFERLGL